MHKSPVQAERYRHSIFVVFMPEARHNNTQRNNSEKLQYERCLNSFEDFTHILQDFTCTLLSITAQDAESTVEDIETKGNPLTLTVFPIEEFLIGILI